MTGKGTLTQSPNRRIKLILFALLAWLILVCVLGAWWGSLILKYASQLGTLEKTQRMLIWEGLTFFILLSASTALLFWLYWRDAKRSRALQAFFASLTHELRTPLTSIRLQAESIAEDSKGHPLVRRLLEDTLRLEAQVERTLELARIEGGGPLFAQPLRLKPWSERILHSLADSYQGRLEIASNIENSVISADSTALQVILKNLFENTVRHSKKDKTKVELTTKQDPKGGVLLIYQDFGEGFDGNPKTLGKLFHKGSRSQGAGVGLYLIKVLMVRMGGRAHFIGTPSFRAELWFEEGQSNV